MGDNDLKKIRSVIREEIASTEQRLEKRITTTEQRLRKDIISTEQRIIGEVGKFVEDQLLSQLEEKADKADIGRLERKFDHFASGVNDHDNRLSNIESIPAIAHELKSPK